MCKGFLSESVYWRETDKQYRRSQHPLNWLAHIALRKRFQETNPDPRLEWLEQSEGLWGERNNLNPD